MVDEMSGRFKVKMRETIPSTDKRWRSSLRVTDSKNMELAVWR